MLKNRMKAKIIEEEITESFDSIDAVINSSDTHICVRGALTAELTDKAVAMALDTLKEYLKECCNITQKMSAAHKRVVKATRDGFRLEIEVLRDAWKDFRHMQPRIDFSDPDQREFILSWKEDCLDVLWDIEAETSFEKLGWPFYGHCDPGVQITFYSDDE